MEMTIEDKLFYDYRDNNRSESINLLYKMVKPWVFKMIFRITADSEAAKDIMQDMWIIVIENMYKLNPEKGRINNYIYTTAKNLAFKWKTKDNKFVHDSNDEDGYANFPEAEDNRPNPGITLEISERNKALKAAISKLPIDYQDVMILYYLTELNVNEVSQILIKPEGTIKTLMSRGRVMLENILSKNFKSEYIMYLRMFFSYLMIF
jgi:RNA polymerase sigma-70 factor (ECF subfamily)